MTLGKIENKQSRTCFGVKMMNFVLLAFDLRRLGKSRKRTSANV